MGKKILILSVVVFIVVFWSSFIVGVDSSAVLRHKRQAEESAGNAANVEDNPFGADIGNERGAPSDPKETPGSGVVAAPSSGDNATTTTTTTIKPIIADNTTQAEKTGKADDNSTVTVTVVIVILVLAVVLGVAVFIFLRIRRKRMADYEKKTQIQMSSTSNAGVYIDLTSAPAGEKEKHSDSPEAEHLNKEEE